MNLSFEEQTNELALSQLSSTHAVIQCKEVWEVKLTQLQQQVPRRAKSLCTNQKRSDFHCLALWTAPAEQLEENSFPKTGIHPNNAEIKQFWRKPQKTTNHETKPTHHHTNKQTKRTDVSCDHEVKGTASGNSLLQRGL